MGPKSKNTRNTGKVDCGKIRIIMRNKNTTPGIGTVTLG